MSNDHNSFDVVTNTSCLRFSVARSNKTSVERESHTQLTILDLVVKTMMQHRLILLIIIL